MTDVAPEETTLDQEEDFEEDFEEETDDDDLDSTHELVDNVIKGDNVGASNIFNQIMASKLQNAIDNRKIEVSSSIYQREEWWKHSRHLEKNFY